MPLIQPIAEVKRPGESLKLPCKFSGFNFTKYWMQWVQQAHEIGLTWIGEVSTNGVSTNVPQSLRPRFSITRDNTNNMVHFEMRNLQADDSATYYCAAHCIAG